jgi:hypothetical protein
MTTYSDVMKLAHQAWKADDIRLWERTHNKDVVDWAIAYEHEPATIEEVQKILRTSTNPLAKLPRQEEVISVQDAYVDWPISFVFHRVRQDFGYEIPTHEEFWDYMKGSGRSVWLDPMYEQVSWRQAGSMRGNIERAIYARAMKGWQSCVRELHMGALLLLWGHDAHFHPAADLKLFADGWVDEHIFALHVRGRYYERKKHPEDIFPLTFKVHHLDVTGNPWEPVWLVNATELKGCFA